MLILIINLVHQVMKMVMTLSAPESGNVTWCLRPGAVLEMGTLMGTLGKYFIPPFFWALVFQASLNALGRSFNLRYPYFLDGTKEILLFFFV